MAGGRNSTFVLTLNFPQVRRARRVCFSLPVAFPLGATDRQASQGSVQVEGKRMESFPFLSVKKKKKQRRIIRIKSQETRYEWHESNLKIGKITYFYAP